MAINRIHHINFVVEDIDAGIETFTKVLGEGEFTKDELSARGVVTARARLGEQWLVLVQPLVADSVPGKYLREKGEGFFLLSLETGDIQAEVAGLADRGIRTTSDQDRKGLLDWWVRDLDVNDTLGVQLQLCEERKSSN